MFSKFEYGDWAWSARAGFSKVQRNEGHSTHSLRHGSSTYTPEGRFWAHDAHPSLLTEAEAAKLGHIRPGGYIAQDFRHYKVAIHILLTLTTLFGFALVYKSFMN